MSSRYVQPLRIVIQFGFLLFMLWLGLLFYRFVQAVSLGAGGAIPVRPGGLEGFLPISGLMGTVSWVKGGEINSIHPAAVVIFLTVILLSFLLRRSFCSWICPIATISELLWKGGFRLLRRNYRLPMWADVTARSVKYLLMAFFVLSIVIGMSSHQLSGFIRSDYHLIADVRLMNFFLHMSQVALIVITVLLLLSVVLRNPFCRYLCPYGALLGLVAVISPTRVTRNLDRCVSCGVCSQVCPTYIDVMHKTSVASPECLACWRCVSHCRVNEALSMRAFQRFLVPGLVFAILVVLVFWGGSVIGKLNGHWVSSITLEKYVRLLKK